MKIYPIMLAMTLLLCSGSWHKTRAQELIVNPEISYAGTPRSCTIGGIAVKGVEGYEDYVLIGLSGLSEGQQITVPGSEITDAIRRYWRHGLFSKVSISADSIVNSKVYLTIHLAPREHHQLQRSDEVGARGYGGEARHYERQSDHP